MKKKEERRITNNKEEERRLKKEKEEWTIKPKKMKKKKKLEKKKKRIRKKYEEEEWRGNKKKRIFIFPSFLPFQISLLFLFQFHSFFRFRCFLLSFPFVFISSSQLPAIILFVLTCHFLFASSTFSFSFSPCLEKAFSWTENRHVQRCTNHLSVLFSRKQYFERKERKIKM